MTSTAPLTALRTRRVDRLRHRLAEGPLPAHIALIMDGNRRWARQRGLANPSLGHRIGAEHLDHVLAWCSSLGIEHVTVYVCSTENLQRRSAAEVGYLMQVIEQIATDRLARPDASWKLHVAGRLDALPASTAAALREAVAASSARNTGAHLTLAIGYGGRQEVVEAVRSLIRSHAQHGGTLGSLAGSISQDSIAAHLYTAGSPEPDLIIRTSGERRMSNFLLWQSVHSELHICKAFWPAFRELDFLRAIRRYAASKGYTARSWPSSAGS